MTSWTAISSKNKVDAVTGATLGSYGTITMIWNGTNVSGNVVPDGDYLIYVEMGWGKDKTTQHSVASFKFTKGTAETTVSPSATTNYTNVSIKWIPDIVVTNMKEKACESYKSPSGKYTWTQTGTYMDTLKNIQGQDSLLSINLMIGKPSTVFDTLSILVGDEKFKATGSLIYNYEPKVLTSIYGCDSVINSTLKFLYSETILDTVHTTVEDTLHIWVVTNIANPLSKNLILVFPNPASDFINIDFGNIASMVNYSCKISNQLGQVVWQSGITSKLKSIGITTLGGSGTYYVQVFDNNGALKESRAIIIH